jgi:neutral ceramidase
MKNKILFPLLTCCSIFLGGVKTQAQNASDVFKAGVSKVNITPELSKQLLGYHARKSVGVMDSIYHRIVYMNDGRTSFYLISSDLCIISPEEYDKVAARLHKELGIHPHNFWWTTTHTHSAPEVGVADISKAFMGERYLHDVDTEYTAFVENQLVDGIKQAQAQAVAAKFGTGWGTAYANINRRAIDENGKAHLGMNLTRAVDRKIGMFRIDDLQGNAMAIIANYAMHGTVLGSDNNHISGDGPGIVADYVEKKTGATMLFINGAAGNVAPLYSTGPKHFMPYFKSILGDPIIETYKNIQTRSQVNFRVGALNVETPRRMDFTWPSNLKNYVKLNSKGEEQVLLPVRFWKVNDDVAVWGAPVEMFCEIAMDIREQSPFPYTFFYGYTNGWFGYLLTAEEYKYGGYEPTVSSFTPAAEKDLKEAVLGYLYGPMLDPGPTSPKPKAKTKK